jgi:PAS domain S-box-containing protein
MSSPPEQQTAERTLGPGRRELADAMPHIVWTDDENSLPTYFNRKWVEYTGLTLEESLRTGVQNLVHAEDLPRLQKIFAEARESGGAFSTRYRLRRAKDGLYRWHEARVVPLELKNGRVVSFVGTAVDIDDAYRLEQKQRFLAEAGRVLGTSLDLKRTLSDVARLVVPHLADWCAVDLLDDAGRFQRVAVAHVDPSKVSVAQRLWERNPPRPEDPQGAYAVVRSRKAELLEDIPDALLADNIQDAELLAMYRSLGLRSAMTVPLLARERVLGTLTLVTAESERRYGKDELVFAEDFAGRIAIATDNARLYAEAQEARAAAEALAADVIEQSRGVESALLAMRAERDAALARLKQAERAKDGGA